MGEGADEFIEKLLGVTLTEEQRRAVLDHWATEFERRELRDRFAAAALTGEISIHGLEGNETEDTAIWAYEMADAMLAARDAK